MQYVSLLRGINVSGQKKIPMQALRQLYETMNYSNIQSYIQTGNIIFETPETDKKKIINTIHTNILNTFGFSTEIILKNSQEFQTIINQQPLRNYIKNSLDTSPPIYLTFLNTTQNITSNNTISKDLTKETAIREKLRKNEHIHQINDIIYFFCPKEYGKTKLSNNFLEKYFNTTATTRNWKTIKKIEEYLQ